MTAARYEEFVGLAGLGPGRCSAPAPPPRRCGRDYGGRYSDGSGELVSGLGVWTRDEAAIVTPSVLHHVARDDHGGDAGQDRE